MGNPDTILVFQTNITSGADKICAMVQNLPGIQRCTIDLDDCDRVLRVIGDRPCADIIRATIRRLGFLIDEMSDSILPKLNHF